MKFGSFCDRGGILSWVLKVVVRYDGDGRKGILGFGEEFGGIIGKVWELLWI